VGELAGELRRAPILSRARAVKLLDAVCQARWLVEQARHYERKARFDLEGLLDVEGEQWEPQWELAGPAGGTGSLQPAGYLASSFGEPDEMTTAATATAGARTAGEYAELRWVYSQAVAEREQAERRYTQLVNRRHMQQERSAVWQADLVRAPVVVGYAGGRFRGGVVLLVGLLAFVAAGAMYWRVLSLDGLQLIDSVEDLQGAVAIPMIGRITLDPLPRAAWRRRFGGRVVRAMVAASEAILLLVCILFLVSALRTTLAWQQLLDSPLNTLLHYAGRSLRP
jgi:hypothetical protein